MARRDKYPVDSFVYYRDNVGDLIVARVVVRGIGGHFLTVRPGWYAEEPTVPLPLRSISGSRKLVRIPVTIIERAELYAPA
jgi:hypothetical protein